MTQPELVAAVAAFADLTQHLSDADLERPWAWRSYDGEGVRFAFFRVFEELRTLTVQLEQARADAGQPATSAQRILALYHTAYRDLYAALRGVTDRALVDAPVEGQWPVRQVLGHIAGADAGFLAVMVHALQQLRAGVSQPLRVDLASYEAILGMQAAEEDAILEGPLAGIVEFHARVHSRVLRELADIREGELELPSAYWEDGPLSVRFRLHRFESHSRQHTVQIDKALAALGEGPSEARRLLRVVYGGLAGAEGALIGVTGIGADEIHTAARAIAGYTSEVAGALRG